LKEYEMPLLEVSQSRQISASIHLDGSTALQLDQYASFIHASADEVIGQALVYVFSKDREFQEFLKSPEAAKVSPTLRIRKAAHPSQVAEGMKKPTAVPSNQQNGGVRLGEARA